ncbi:MAG: hydroxyacid dehydrogenase [Microbacteriaceae bacterium]
MNKKIFIPGVFTHTVGVDMFEAAPNVELIWGLPDSGRTYEDADLSDFDELLKLSQSRLDEYLPEIHALHAMGLRGHLPVTAEMMDRAKNLEIIFIQAAGADSIDIAAATERGILVLNAPGANASAVSEHATALMLALARKVALADRYAHQDQKTNAGQIYGLKVGPSLLSKKNLGILGFGYIGRSLAKIAQYGFDMNISVYDPYFDPIEAERLGFRLVELDELLATSDFVSVHAPLTAGTANIINKETLALMKPTAYLINTARGGLVNTDDLVSALETGTIAGAGLDVTEPEPLPQGHRLFQLDNVVITPHTANVSAESKEATSRISTQLVLDAWAGRRPSQMLNAKVWDSFLHKQK